MEANINQSGSPACGSTPQICSQSAKSAVSPTPLAFRWESEVSAPKPFRARAFHGESFTLACTPTQYAAPLTGLAGATVTLRWQTDGMAPDAWYEKAGEYDPATGTLSADWGPDCDTGPDRVRFFLALETPGGASFRAFGALDLAPSPGFTPAQLLPESELSKLQDALKDETQARQQADSALETALQVHTKRCVPLLNPGERADPDTHGKTALVTQNGTQGGFAVSGDAGAAADAETYVTRYQCDAITVRGGPGLAPKVYKLSATGNAEGETVAQIQDVSNCLDVHNANKDAHQPMQDALKALIGQKADTGHTHDNRYLRLSGGTLSGTLTVNASITASSFKIPQGGATHIGEVISIKNGPTMAGAVGIVYSRPQQSNFKPVFLGVSGGDTDSRIYLGDGSVSTAETGLTTVFGLYTPDDRTWARHDLWFTDKLGDAQGSRTWWGLVQDGDELRIVKDKGTPVAYAPQETTYTKAEVDGKVAGVYHYKGSVASRAALPASPAVGDVYNIQDEDGQNVAWTGSAWDALGATVDLSAYDTAQTTQGKITAAVAPKANSADVYPKAQTYTKTEVQSLIAEAVAAAKTQLLAQLEGLYAPLSSVQATVGGTTYRWAWDDTFQTFAMKQVSE